MIHVRLLKGFLVTDAPGLDAHTDVVMDELVALETEFVTDADMSADFEACTVELSVVAAAESFDEAVSLADSTIRAAIHAAGGSTSKWKVANFTPQKSEADLLPA